MFKKRLITAIFILFVISAGAQSPVKKSIYPEPARSEMEKIKAANIKKAAAAQFQYFIIKAESNTYGYSIYADGNLYIEQHTIPGIAGTTGFRDTASAGKTALLVIKKIKNGEMPPTITIEDLKIIGVP